MTRVQAVTRRVHERGVEWISAPGVRIGDGVPRVRGERRKVSGLSLYDLILHEHVRRTTPPPLGVPRRRRGFLSALFGSGCLWIALVFGITLIR